MKRLNVATLAVGTEVTDGQIVDRNSAILSQLAVDLGFSIVEHRAVPDDREMITSSLNDLSKKADVLFVTGGLGPTSDDFTRELIAKYVGSELKFDEESWQHVLETLASRGVAPREVQKQQCYFPPGAKIYKNPAGTANAFGVSKDGFKIFALPGPPVEIMAVWNSSLKADLENLVPIDQREVLNIWRCLGRGESDISELAEPVVKAAGLRVGYRAHAPYVEVKVWSTPSNESGDSKKEAAFAKLNEVLGPYLVNRDKQDLAKDFLTRAKSFAELKVFDGASAGLLSERLFSIIRDEKIDLRFKMETATTLPEEIDESKSTGLHLKLEADQKLQKWIVTLIANSQTVATSEVKPIYNHKVESERGRKYICEKALQIALTALAKKG